MNDYKRAVGVIRTMIAELNHFLKTGPRGSGAHAGIHAKLEILEELLRRLGEKP